MPLPSREAPRRQRLRHSLGRALATCRRSLAWPRARCRRSIALPLACSLLALPALPLLLFAGWSAAAPAPPGRSAAEAVRLAKSARERCGEVSRRGSWTEAEIAGLAAQLLVDPPRFAADAEFRRWVVELLPREVDPRTDRRLRDDLLLALNRLPSFAALDDGAVDAIQSAWGVAPRRALDRRSAYGREPLRFEDDASTPIAASVFSLPSSFFEAPAVTTFLAAVRAVAPRREILVLTDLPVRRRLEQCCGGLRLHLLETYGRPYSPWTRDPMSLTHRPGGGVVVLVRPNAQPGREADRRMGAELVRQLPPVVDRAWGRVRWEEAPVPFHNGQVLQAQDAAWISVHTLEPRILALLGMERVPVESFAGAAGIQRYFGAARRAAAELAQLYGRPVRFVHPLPPEAFAAGDERQLADARELVLRIGGGAGHDLDALLTLLPAAPEPAIGNPATPSIARRSGRQVALVASLAAGRTLLSGLTAADWQALRSGYDLAPAEGDLAAALGAAQQAPGAAGLDAFLDLIAAHLVGQGFRVERLPLLVVPVTLLADPSGVGAKEFLLTWNNVALETRDGQLRAEGFSSLVPAGDEAARRTFGAAGCRLDLLPALVHSVVLNGGYRCASNHLRALPTKGGR